MDANNDAAPPSFTSAYSNASFSKAHDSAQKEWLYRETLSLLPLIHAKIEAKAYTAGGQDFEMLFEYFDLNRDGKLTNEELRIAVRRNLGIPPAVLSDRHIRLVFNALDEDRSGSLELAEFINFIMKGPEALQITEEMVVNATKEIKLTRDQKMPWLKRQHKAVKALKKMYPRRLGHVKHEKEPETDYGWVPEVSHGAEVKLADGEWHTCEISAGPSLVDGSYTVKLPELKPTSRTLVKGGRLVPEVLTGANLVLAKKWAKTQKKDPLAALNKVDTYPTRMHAYVSLDNLRPIMLKRHHGKNGPEFEIGDEVEAQDRASQRWYPASVIAQPDLRKKQTAATLGEYDVEFNAAVFGNERHRRVTQTNLEALKIPVRRRAGVGERAEAVCIGLRSSSEAQRCVAAAEARSLARDRLHHAELNTANLPGALEYALDIFLKQQSATPSSRPTTGAFARIMTPGTPGERRIATPDISSPQRQAEMMTIDTPEAPTSPGLLATAAQGLSATASAPALPTSLPPIKEKQGAADEKRKNQLLMNLTAALRMLKQKKTGKYFT